MTLESLCNTLVTNKRALRVLFEALDRDGSGALDALELAEGLHELGLAKSVGSLERLLNDVDEDGDGRITYIELVHWARAVAEK